MVKCLMAKLSENVGLFDSYQDQNIKKQQQYFFGDNWGRQNKRIYWKKFVIPIFFSERPGCRPKSERPLRNLLSPHICQKFFIYACVILEKRNNFQKISPPISSCFSIRFRTAESRTEILSYYLNPSRKVSPKTH